MIDFQNEQPKKIAEFTFITNKSFFGPGNPITIPSRFYPLLKENGLRDSAMATIYFADHTPVPGTLKMGWRAGGKYFQIRAKTSNHSGANVFQQGSSLRVLLIKVGIDWRIELRHP